MTAPRFRLFLAGILALALALRGAGLRAFPVADESQAVATAILLESTGESVPPAANWPPAIYYLLRGALRAGLALGVHPSLGEVQEDFARGWYRREPGPLHFLTRAVSLACGVGLVALAGAIGKRLAGHAAGLLAALGVAISPLACASSRYALTDAPHALAAAGSVLLALAYLDSGARAACLASGALAGAAFSTKYLGALALLAPIAAGLLRRPRSVREAGVPVALAGLGFLAGGFLSAPSLFLHPRPYLDWLGRHAESTGWEWLGFEGEPRGWIYHAARTIPWALGSPLLVGAAAIGLAWGWRNERRRTLVLLAFAIPYYGLVGANRILYARYLLPLVPALCALAGAGLARALPSVLPARLLPRFALAACAAIAFGTAFLGEADRVRALRLPDTRRLAMEWMEANLPAGTRVLTAVPVYVPGGELLPDFAYPPADPARFEWKNLAHRLEPRLLVEFARASRGADVYVWSGFVDPLLEARRGPDYAAFARELATVPLLASFDPGGSPDGRIPREERSGLGVAGRSCTRAGPAIRIYRLAGG